MKLLTLGLALGLLGLGFGAGWYLGRPTASSSTPSTANESASTVSNTVKLPPITTKPRAVSVAVAQMSAAEAIAALQELRGKSRADYWERVNEVIKALHPADYPEVFAAVPSFSLEMQSMLRNSLLVRWGESDPRAAMDAAAQIKNFNERHQGILTVLRGWAKIDATGAAAWVEKLPPGRLRSDAPQVLAQILAETDPEAAFALMKNSSANREHNYGAFHGIFDAWAAKDPLTAAARASEIKNWQQRQNAY